MCSVTLQCRCILYCLHPCSSEWCLWTLRGLWGTARGLAIYLNFVTVVDITTHHFQSFIMFIWDSTISLCMILKAIPQPWPPANISTHLIFSFFKNDILVFLINHFKNELKITGGKYVSKTILAQNRSFFVFTKTFSHKNQLFFPLISEPPFFFFGCFQSNTVTWELDQWPLIFGLNVISLLDWSHNEWV